MFKYKNINKRRGGRGEEQFLKQHKTKQITPRELTHTHSLAWVRWGAEWVLGSKASNRLLLGKLLTAAYGENLPVAETLDMVSNSECPAGSSPPEDLIAPTTSEQPCGYIKDVVCEEQQVITCKASK